MVVEEESHQQHLRPELARSQHPRRRLAGVNLRRMASSPSGSTRGVVHRNPPGGWVDGCGVFFFSPRTSNGETRASEPGCSCVMDGCLSSPPPGCPPPSGRDWSGALHHICLRGNILQQLMGDRATAAAAAAAASGSYIMSASVWVYTGTIFFPPFRFVTKGGTLTIFVCHTILLDQTQFSAPALL